jgi:hypothetical protein
MIRLSSSRSSSGGYPVGMLSLPRGRKHRSFLAETAVSRHFEERKIVVAGIVRRRRQIMPKMGLGQPGPSPKIAASIGGFRVSDPPAQSGTPVPSRA